TDCHTPGHLLGKPDMSRFLGGSDVGLEVPGLGVFVAPNLTPDKVTGLGNWTKDQIATAIDLRRRSRKPLCVPGTRETMVTSRLGEGRVSGEAIDMSTRSIHAIGRKVTPSAGSVAGLVMLDCAA